MINDIHNSDVITGFSDKRNRKFRSAQFAHSGMNRSMGIGDRIREAREAAGLTQDALGKLVGRSQSAVAEWESSDSAPRRNVMDVLASTLNVERAWLEYGDAAHSGAPELAIDAGTLTERQLLAAMGPILRVLGVLPENRPVVARALLRAIQAAQSLDRKNAKDRFEIAGEYAAQEVQREIPPSRRR